MVKSKVLPCSKLVRNAIGIMLETVILSCRVAAVALLNQVPHIIRGLSVRLLQYKSVPEILDGLRFEAR